MKMETIETPTRSSPGLETIDVTLTVTRFQSVLDATGGSALTDFTMSGPEEGNARLKVGDFQKSSPPGMRHTLRVQRPGVVFRLTVAADGADGESYLPVGISFERADQTEPVALSCTTETRNKSDSPFSGLEINGSTVQFIDRPLSNVRAKGEEAPPRRVTYKFSVFIQRQRDGALGLIDPWIENENLA